SLLNGQQDYGKTGWRSPAPAKGQRARMNALAIAQQPQGMMPQSYGMEQEPEREYNTWDLAKKVRAFEDSEEATDTARQQSERCRDYYDNKQLTAAELAILKARGQPDIIINRIQSKVN